MMPALAMIGAMLTPSSLSITSDDRQDEPVTMLLSSDPIVWARWTRRVAPAASCRLRAVPIRPPVTARLTRLGSIPGSARRTMRSMSRWRTHRTISPTRTRPSRARGLPTTQSATFAATVLSVSE